MGNIEIVLFCNENGSDKEYRAQIETEGNGFVVNFQYGRRGQVLKSGTKTSKPLEYSAAKKVFDKLVAEKLAKGYVAASSSAESSGFVKAHVDLAVGAFLPQLCNAVDGAQLPALFASEQWERPSFFRPYPYQQSPYGHTRHVAGHRRWTWKTKDFPCQR
ncbi:WGR domain-containing protein [Ferrovum sp.]|uniref:WGR domain-containing protein n=1 Tax=Ferrovum sp. TaxID=2609467 RepID=UPI00262DC4A7|nr:WGR domain-containing protein [Ferrovum sp.]